MSDKDLDLGNVDLDKVLSGMDFGENKTIKQNKKTEDSVYEKIKIPRNELTKLIEDKLLILNRDIDYYDNLTMKYRNKQRKLKEKNNYTDEELLIQYQEELNVLKEIIIENTTLVPLIKRVKEYITKLVMLSGQIYPLENIYKTLDEYIKIYSNHAYQDNQISIIVREINKLRKDQKSITELSNIDFIND